MTAYDDLVAQAHAALNECDHKIAVAKLAIEDLKQKIVGLQLERRKIAALLPGSTPAKPRSADAAPTGAQPTGVHACPDCDRTFGAAAHLGRHRSTAHKAEGTAALVEAGGSTAQAMLAAEDIPDDPAQLVASSDEVVADVLAYWDELTDLLPIVRVSKAEVRSIVHANERAVA